MVRDDDERRRVTSFDAVAVDDRHVGDRPDGRLEHGPLRDVPGGGVRLGAEAVAHVAGTVAHVSRGVAGPLGHVSRGTARLVRDVGRGLARLVRDVTGPLRDRVESLALVRLHDPAGFRRLLEMAPETRRTALLGAWRTNQISTL